MLMRLRVVSCLLSLLLGFVPFPATALDQADIAELYLFVFRDGQTEEGVRIRVGTNEASTDSYGVASFEIPSGDYDVAYYKNGEVFALTDVRLVANQQSQVFLNLHSTGPRVDLDLPINAYEQQFDSAKVRQQASGPKGTVKLKLVDGQTDKPVAGAKVYIKGYDIEGLSDSQGVATMELSAGEYDLSVIHPKYVMQVLKQVPVKVDQGLSQQVKLLQANIVMQEYVVTAPAVEGSLASTFTELKESAVIGDALSSEQFSKSGDSSAADALKRVTGITVVDGKYVYVRGLGERYSTVLLNGMLVPSPEPTKRVVPLNIFPAGVIQSMDIRKTYSVDLPGTFAGGDVLIVSKDIPEEDNYAKLTMGASTNQATGKEVYHNEDNTKGLPKNIIDKSSNFQELQQGFPPYVPGYTVAELHEINSQIVNYRHYDLQKTTLQPGEKLSVDVGQSFKTRGGLKYGVVGSLYSTSSAKLKEATKFSSYYDIPTNTLSAGERSDYQHTVLNDKQGGLLSLALDGQDGNKVKYTFLGLDDRSNSTTFSEKDGGPAGPGIDDQQRTYYEYVEKQITTHQLTGEHLLKFTSIDSDLLDDIQINWGAETAKATRYEPGTVEYYYERTSDVTDYTLNKKIWYLYSDLEDKVDNYRVDLRLPYKYNDGENYTEVGYFGYNKSRKLDNRRFKAEHALGTDVFQNIDSVFTQQNVDNGDLELTSNYRPDDAYTAIEDVAAFYLNQRLWVQNNVEILAGVRHESSTQQLIDTKSGIPYDPLVTSDNLTQLGVNYGITENHKIRFAYANTLSRPDFREFSPNRYKDPITEDIVFGFPGLKYTTIDNLDVRYEWYISYDEMLTFGLFKKDFTNPVETIVNQDPDSQSGKKIISYRNALGATSTGVEFSLRKKLGFFGSFFENYFIETNYAVINSNIRLDANSDDIMITELSSKERPMQGQSPYVINLNVGYDNINTGRSVVLLYNEFGERITALGSYGAPDYYEYPFKKLDFVAKWRFNDTYDLQVKKIGYGMDLKVTNILDATVEVRQGSEVIESYKPGLGFNLSFWMKY